MLSFKIPTLLYHGSEKERIQLRSKFKETFKVNNLNCFPVVITTYEVIRFDITFLKSINWLYMTIDEGQKVKNIDAQISVYVKLIAIRFDCINL